MPLFPIALVLLSVGVISEWSGFLSLEWRWLWVTAVTLIVLVERWRDRRIQPWQWLIAALSILLASLSIRRWSGGLDLLPMAMMAMGWLIGSSLALPRSNRKAVMMVGVGFLLLLAFLDLIGIGHPWREPGTGVVAGFFGQRNTFQMAIVLLLPVFLWAVKQWEFPWNRFAGGLAVVMALAPLAERSLTAWLAATVSWTLFMTLIIFGNPWNWSGKTRVAFASTLLFAAALIAIFVLPNDLAKQKSSSLFSRQEIYNDAVAAAIDHTPEGTGLGGFARISRSYTSSDTLSGVIHTSVASCAHNHWLQGWVERGVLGLLWELFLWGAALFALIGLWRRGERLYATYILFGFAAGTIHVFFDLSNYAYPETALLWGALLGFSCSRFPPKWQEKWNRLLTQKSALLWERAALLLLIALLGYGGYLTQLRLRSNLAMAEELQHNAVKPGESLKRIARALEIDKTNPHARYLLVGFLRSNGAWNDAEQHLNYLEQVSGGRFPIATERAFIARGKGDWEGVERWSAEALKRNALWNNSMWALQLQALSRLGKCDRFEEMRARAKEWSWSVDRTHYKIPILSARPDLREMDRLVRYREMIDFMDCPADPIGEAQ